MESVIFLVKVNFYDEVDDVLLKFAVIVAKYNNKLVFCKHKDRDTLEIPGGHRESGENIDVTAKRELFEETGAMEFNIKPVCVYSVTNGVCENFGMLYFADVKSFSGELKNEIEKIFFLDELPQNWTYPKIQPILLKEVVRRFFSRK